MIQSPPSSTRTDTLSPYPALFRSTREAQHRARLFKLGSDRREPGLGIEAMRLAVPQVDALAPEAIGAAFDDDAQAGDIAPLVDQLAGRAGAAALFRLAAVESDVPERAVRRVDRKSTRLNSSH